MGGAVGGHLRGPAAPVVCALALDPSGAKIDAVAVSAGLVATGAGAAVEVWDARTGARLRSLAGHGGAVSALAFSPDGARLASGGFDDAARLWDASAGGGALAVLAGHAGGVAGVAWAPDGTRVLTASRDRTARVWSGGDGDRGGLARTLAGHRESVTCGAFCPAGVRVATGSRDATARLWDPDAETASLRHGAAVYCVDWSADGALVATGGEDAAARLWDARTHEPLRAFDGHKRTVRCVAFAPDSMWLVTGSYDRTVRLWRTSGECAATLRGHRGKVLAAAFLDRGVAATAARDGTVRAWAVGPTFDAAA